MITLGLHDLAFMAQSPPAPSLAQDDIEGYTDLAALNGLFGGTGWQDSYVSITSLDANDDLESYTDTASVNGLNAGTNWDNAFVAR